MYRFIITAATDKSIDLTRAHRQIGRGGREQDRRAAKLWTTLAVSLDGQHVVKRLFLLPAPALIQWLTQ
jgi:hypothetical protein